MHSFQINRLAIRTAAVALLALYVHFWSGIQLHFLFHDHAHSHESINNVQGKAQNQWLGEYQDDCDFCHQVVIAPVFLTDVFALEFPFIIESGDPSILPLIAHCFSVEVSVHHSRGPPVLV